MTQNEVMDPKLRGHRDSRHMKMEALGDFALTETQAWDDPQLGQPEAECKKRG